MSLNADELDVPQGEAESFKAVGDKVRGRVLYIGSWRDRVNNFGKEETVLKIVLDTADGNRSIYPTKGGTMAQAIGQAIKKAGAQELRVGGDLGVKRTEGKEVGKGNPMTTFAAQYEAPKDSAAFDDGEEPF